MADNSVTNSTLEYSQSQQLVILWICLGAGSFLSILICILCRVINRRRPEDIYFPPPLALAAPPRRSLPRHVSVPQAIAPQLTPQLRAAPLLSPARSIAKSIRQYRNEAAGLTEPALQDGMVLEMMQYTREALPRSRVEFPMHYNASSSSNSVHVELSSRPPADARAAIEEMMMYTNGILESSSLERPRPKSTLSHFPQGRT